MAIDRDQALAVRFPTIDVEVERGRLRFFAEATGQADPVYTDVDAAKLAGHRDLPVPPTFFFGLELAAPDPFGFLGDLDIDLGQVLHGEQSFEYHDLAYAGDLLTVDQHITDAFSKKDLGFLVKQTSIRRDGELIAVARSVIIVRPRKAAA